MRRLLQLLALSGLLGTASLSTAAFAQEPAETDAAPDAAANSDASTAKAEPAAAAPAPAPPAAAPVDEAPRPKIGDTTTQGYFRGGFGASSQKGRQTCFGLALNGGLRSKYRLGNECEVWAEYGLNTVVYSGQDHVVGTVHFMPTAFIPTSFIGYSPTGATASLDPGVPSTGAVVAFPNLYVDLAGIPWLNGGTAWVGTRYYKRESVYISDFFYWNPSGVGAGVEDIHIGPDLRLSYGAFAVDGQPLNSPPLPSQIDLGIRNDLQLRGIRPYKGGEFQVGFQYIADFSNDKNVVNGVATSNTHGGWGATLQHVQDVLGGNNKLAIQYGKGGGTGFGTLARFYYPDFSLRPNVTQSRLRILDVLTIQPVDWFGAQVVGVYQRDDEGTGVSGAVTTWYSAGARASFAFVEHAKAIGEFGYDQVNKSNGSQTDPQTLAKGTLALAVSSGKALMARPELRLFTTYARWSETARIAVIDSARIYTDNYPTYLSGWTFGLQGEAWW
jgi:maltoporin